MAGSSTDIALRSTVRPGMLLRVALSTENGKRAITMEVRTLEVVIVARHDNFGAGLEVIWGI